jgi:hypothetical protein
VSKTAADDERRGVSWDQSDGTRAPLGDPKTLAETDGKPDGFQDFLLALRDQVVAFRKPVAYVHGDSHYFRIDRPFLDSQGLRLENFVRVGTFGDNQGNGNNDVQWLKVWVDARTREVFSFQPQNTQFFAPLRPHMAQRGSPAVSAFAPPSVS